MTELAWPYPNEMDREERLSADVLVLGGGMAGCYAAIAAARKGRHAAIRLNRPQAVLEVHFQEAPPAEACTAQEANEGEEEG